MALRTAPLNLYRRGRGFYTSTGRGVRQASSTAAVKLLEVGPRDGLQNITTSISTPVTVELIRRLASVGLRHIEATSFVSPKWVPQLADGANVMKEVLPLSSQSGIRLPVLVPNMKGLQNAIKSGATEIILFASATEAFSRKNQNCTVEEALVEAEKVAAEARSHDMAVRGVISCIFSDPYSGPTDPKNVLDVAKRFLAMGCYEVGLGDTLGVGTPKDTQKLLEVLLKEIPAEKLAGHFHDTYGQAIANVTRSYKMGIRSFDSSVAGLGGCPFAKGARGNLATEDIVYTLENSGIATGVDLDKLVSIGDWISRELGVPNNSRAGAALVAKGHGSPEKQAQTTSQAVHQPIRGWKIVDDTGEMRVSRAGNAVKVTLTRPQKGNSMTPTMLEGLTRLFETLARDQTVFHVVLAAEGKFFCTGMDLSGNTDRTSQPSDQSSYYSKVVNLFRAVDEAPQTTIVLIDGPCFGGGVGLAFACDVRLVSERARWTLTEITLGLSPAIISKYLAREWGISFFREAMLSGRQVTPQELQRIGAIHQLHSDSSSLDAALDTYLTQLDHCAPQSAAACKELVRLAWMDPNGAKQESVIQEKFDTMMQPGSEGEFGIKQFQQKIKKINWAQFWSSNVTVPPDYLVQPKIEGWEWIDLPTYSFYIKHNQSGREVLFDLGSCKDWENLPPHIEDLIKNVVHGYKVTKNVLDILPDGHVSIDNVEALVLSHWHFDHCGSPFALPKTVRLVVGPGFKDAFLPGWPSKEDSPFSEADVEGREVIEISFSGLKLGRFDAYDYFRDGCFYILNVPGHATGHISGLAQMFAISPASYVPHSTLHCHEIPADATLDRRISSSYPCAAFTAAHPDQKNARNTPFVTVSDGPHTFYHDPEEARKSISALLEFDADPNVSVVIAHDPTSLDVFDFFSKPMNGWKQENWKQKAHGGSLSELPYNGKMVRYPRVDGLYQADEKVQGLQISS